MTRLSRFILLAALGVAVALLGFHQLALTDLIFGKGDAYNYFTPLWAARDAALRGGQLPLWTDALFMGAPLLADSQLGTFYPPNWLTVGLPAWAALKVSVFVHVAWAAVGAYVLARRALGVGIAAAIVAAGTFALGGYVGAHAEQINQLQGIAWMPWAFLSCQRSAFSGQLQSRQWLSLTLNVFALAAVMALVALSGHTQTLFITGVGLGIYALAQPFGRDTDGIRRPFRQALTRYARLASGHLVVLIGAAVMALILAAVQLLPTMELTGLSNRQGGFSALSAMAFSWQPNLAARGLLPSLDGQVFGEYIAYLGVIGLALALWGVLSGGRRRWPWLILAVAGVVLAFGLYNPLYWALAELPGFNFFRVPARWLGLFALGGAMLAALGAESLLTQTASRPWRALAIVLAVIGALALLAVWRSPLAALEVDGEARPTLATLALWAAAAVLFCCAVLLRAHVPRRVVAVFVVVLTLGELALAATNMPHRDLVDPSAATDPRLTAHWLHADEQQASGTDARFLSISLGYFDTYDRAALLDRYARLGMTERAAKAGLTSAKNKELLAPNFPLLYDVPSADGFGGGLLPTVYYTAFTSLILPDGLPRTIDGRLRELLAQPDCFGACVPERRWLDLMRVGHLLLDKTYDRFYDDVQFDVGLRETIAPDVPYTLAGDPALAADTVALLVEGDAGQSLAVAGFALAERRAVDDGLTLLRFTADPAPRATLQMTADAPVTLRAVSLVDSRTGAFSMLALGGWRKVLSSDIKLYETLAPVTPFVAAREVTVLPDTWDGSEAALALMRDPSFDPMTHAILHGAPDGVTAAPNAKVDLSVVSRTDTRIEYDVTVTGGEAAALVLNDAYFPGWTATIDGEPTPLYRADVMFRAVVVPEGRSTLVVEYRPPWLTPLLWGGAAAWLIFGVAWLALSRLTARRD